MFTLDTETGSTRAKNRTAKPNREGGNNDHHSSTIRFLEVPPGEERMAWTSMVLIRIPRGVKNVLVHADGGETVEVEVINELGALVFAFW
ncbi:glutathione synthetase [Moniliophthora roreri]|nr:glutathione synthetase [Moniliophthora roreri]